MNLKKFLSLLLVFVLFFISIVPTQANAATPRMQLIAPGLSFSNTTAQCELTVNCDYLTDEITATIKLWNGSSCVATWYKTDTGYMNFYATRTVVKGNTYELTADVTINGEVFPTVSITRTC